MNLKLAGNLACPIDGKQLVIHQKSLRCESGHLFDIARQGYVNLLPVQYKRSKQPGDSKEMVVARAAFLNSGIYGPIANKLAELVCAQIAEDEETCVMDAGCGEGYYLDYVFNYLTSKDCSTDVSFIGMDISKPAIVESTKRNKQITWVVGTNRQPPVDKNSVDIIFCVFGFHSLEPFFEILKVGGKLILVDPGPDHLQELREIIYTDVKRSKPQELANADDVGFSLVNEQLLQFSTGLINNELINKLLVMTPHFYRASKEGREAASKLSQLELTVDVVIRMLEKKKQY